jgi:uncharacterized protein YjbJ (UPF0337 family)
MNLRVRRLWRFFARIAWVLLFSVGDGYWTPEGARRSLGGSMGFLDKLLGRGKKATGDMKGDASMRAEGAAQERQADAEDRAADLENKAQDAREQAAQAQAKRENP